MDLAIRLVPGPSVFDPLCGRVKDGLCASLTPISRVGEAGVVGMEGGIPPSSIRVGDSASSKKRGALKAGRESARENFGV